MSAQSGSQNSNTFINKGNNKGNQSNIVEGDQNYNVTEQDLTKAATEIQQLLEQLSQASQADKEAAVVKKVENQIKFNPILKDRLKKALKSGGIEALKQALDLIYKNPIISVSVETIKGFLEAE